MQAEPSGHPQRVTHELFGRVATGQPVDLYTLRNQRGLEVRIATYGGTIISLRTPDRNGAMGDIVLGFGSLDDYAQRSPYFGCLVGRFANRIAKGRFVLDGVTYQLSVNDGQNHLHGGLAGWDKVVWTAATSEGADRAGLTLHFTSPDGDQGYPGTVIATATYTLSDDNVLALDCSATTDRPTIVNIAQHSYFNLAAGQSTDILSHEMQIDADEYTPIDATFIPTGALSPVAGTPFDFRTPTTLGRRIGDANEQLERGLGYDHNFVLRRSGSGLAHAARVTDPASGRSLDLHTTLPGLQLYTGNFLDGSLRGRDGQVCGRRSGFCLETQVFPDAPNHPSFPTAVLRPGEVYRSRTTYTFGIV